MKKDRTKPGVAITINEKPADTAGFEELANQVAKALANFPLMTAEDKLRLEQNNKLYKMFVSFTNVANAKQKDQFIKMFEGLLKFMLKNADCDILDNIPVSVQFKKEAAIEDLNIWTYSDQHFEAMKNAYDESTNNVDWVKYRLNFFSLGGKTLKGENFYKEMLSELSAK